MVMTSPELEARLDALQAVPWVLDSRVVLAMAGEDHSLELLSLARIDDVLYTKVLGSIVARIENGAGVAA